VINVKNSVGIFIGITLELSGTRQRVRLDELLALSELERLELLYAI